MPGRNGRPVRGGGRTRKPGRAYNPGWRTWHHGTRRDGNNEDRAWREATERLDAELIEDIEHGGTARPRPEGTA